MRIAFPYQEIPPVDVPDGNLLGFCQPRCIPTAPPAATIVGEALARPLGTPRLADAVRSSGTVLTLIDPAIPPAALADIVPLVLGEVRQGGIGERAVHFLIASGHLHAPLPADRVRQIRQAIGDRADVREHDWLSHHLHVDLGRLADGTPVVVNHHLVEAGFVLGIGHVAPDRLLGFSGGAGIVLPGAAGKPSIDHIAWQAALTPIEEVFGRAANPFRTIANRAAARAGLRYALDVVLDGTGRVVGAWAGDPAQTQPRGAEQARAIYGVTIPEPADICVTDSWPADRDLWEAMRAVDAMALAVKQDGVVVLVTPAPAGVGRAAAIVYRYGFRPVENIEHLVSLGWLEADAAAAWLAAGGRVIKEKAAGILVCPGIDAGVQRQLGFLPAATPQEALDAAFMIRGRDATVLVFHHGSEVLPIVSP